MSRVHAGFFQSLADIIYETGLRHLFTRKVHAHEKGSVRRRMELPLTELLASSLQSPHANGHNHPGFFRQRNEVARIDKASIRMLPADQGFETGELPVVKRNDGLVIQAEFLAIQSAAQIVLHLQQIDGTRMHSFVEDL